MPCGSKYRQGYRNLFAITAISFQGIKKPLAEAREVVKLMPARVSLALLQA